MLWDMVHLSPYEELVSERSFSLLLFPQDKLLRPFPMRASQENEVLDVIRIDKSAFQHHREAGAALQDYLA